MVDGDGADIYKFRKVVLVWNIIAMPCDHVKWGMVLRALEKFPPKLVYNFPGLLLNFVLRNRVQKVSCIGKPICAEGPELR